MQLVSTPYNNKEHLGKGTSNSTVIDNNKIPNKSIVDNNSTTNKPVSNNTTAPDKNTVNGKVASSKALEDSNDAAKKSIANNTAAYNGTAVSNNGISNKVVIDKTNTSDKNIIDSNVINIPAISLNPKNGVHAKMLALVVYKGKIYTESSTEFDSADIKNFLGKKIGRTVNSINEFNVKDKSSEELASNIGEQDIYAVKRL